MLSLLYIEYINRRGATFILLWFHSLNFQVFISRFISWGNIPCCRMPFARNFYFQVLIRALCLSGPILPILWSQRRIDLIWLHFWSDWRCIPGRSEISTGAGWGHSPLRLRFLAWGCNNWLWNTLCLRKILKLKRESSTQSADQLNQLK